MNTAEVFDETQVRDSRPTIVVADGMELIRTGVLATLSTNLGWSVAGEAADGREALLLCRRIRPDVLLLDLNLRELSGIDLLRVLRSENPSTRCIVLTLETSNITVRDALAAGAMGYVLKSDATREILMAVQSVLLGRVFYANQIADAMLKSYTGGTRPDRVARGTPVTAREKEIIQLIARGQTNKEIALTLGISIRTVETHRSNVMERLGLHSGCELLAYAFRNGWVDDDLAVGRNQSGNSARSTPQPTAGRVVPVEFAECRRNSGIPIANSDSPYECANAGSEQPVPSKIGTAPEFAN